MSSDDRAGSPVQNEEENDPFDVDGDDVDKDEDYVPNGRDLSDEDRPGTSSSAHKKTPQLKSSNTKKAKTTPKKAAA